MYSQIFATHVFNIRKFFVYSQFSKFYQIKYAKKVFNYIKNSNNNDNDNNNDNNNNDNKNRNGDNDDKDVTDDNSNNLRIVSQRDTINIATIV